MTLMEGIGDGTHPNTNATEVVAVERHLVLAISSHPLAQGRTSAANAMTALKYVQSKRHISAIPIVGGFCGTLALIVLPINQLRSWWWIPLILHYGSLPMLFGLLIMLIAMSIRGQP